MSGWKLTAALFLKQIGNLGEQIAGRLAAFDPETATQVERDALQKDLHTAALKLADARQIHKKEKDEAEGLEAQINKDKGLAKVLIEKADKGEIEPAVLTEFTNNLEDMISRLPGEAQDAAEALELVTTVQEIVDSIQQRLEEFDQRAAQAQRELRQAQAELDRNQLRLRQQQELSALRTGLSSGGSALGAMAKRAQDMRKQADALGTVVAVGQKPIERLSAVEKARCIAEGKSFDQQDDAVSRLMKLTS
jgi:hypothetical protein